MRNFSKWMLAAAIVLPLGGAMLAIDWRASSAVAAEEKPAGDHWRNFDGKWSYWHEGDKRWYYTDGSHWYYHDGKNWVVYHFDKLFGIKDFHHGDYKAPGPEVKVPLPTHAVYRRP
jgi:hypothetical protein